MKTLNDGTKIYTIFELEMSGIFFRLCGGTTGTFEQESYWDNIQRLKKLAQDELLHETLERVLKQGGE